MATSERTSAESRSANAKRRAATSSSAPRGTAKAKKRIPIEEEEEPTPVISGRFLVAATIIAVLSVIPNSSIGNVLEPTDPPGTDTSQWKTGQTTNVRITVVTADYNLLTCASTQTFEGRHCAYKHENEPWPRDPTAPLDDDKHYIIQPYRTWLDNQLVLVAGMWAQPELAMREHSEPSAGVPSDKLARFVTECRVRFVGQMDKPALRWAPTQSWGNERTTPVGIAESCKIIDEPSPICPDGPVCALMRLFQ